MEGRTTSFSARTPEAAAVFARSEANRRLRVGRRVDRRRGYVYPELSIGSRYLSAAGFQEGDTVTLDVTKKNIVIRFIKRGEPAPVKKRKLKS